MSKFTLLRSFSFSFTFWWICIPNIGAIAMWPIGGPQMAFPMAVCGIAAVAICHSEIVWIRRAGIVFCFLTSVMMYIAISFNLNPTTVVASVEFARELDLRQSPEYLMAVGTILVAMVLAIKFAPQVPKLSTLDHKIMALATVALLILVDGAATAGARGSYKMTAPADAPIDSAMIRNELTPSTVSARNLVVILVESLGQPNNPHDQALFDKAWGKARWSSRYEVTGGTSAYYGSTTNAELREWCSVWKDFESFDFDNAHCLPAQFKDAGFHTTSIHTFTGDFFERQTWHPKLGFQDQLFMPELLGLDAHKCGGVFPGACDTDIPSIIGDKLRSLPDQRNLIYWLTLNSHLPVAEDSDAHTDNCRLADQNWNEQFPMLCRSYLLQQRLADSIMKEVMRPDFPEADILIVGDHMPPFFQRALRNRYDAEHVPWIMLRNRRALDRSRQGAAL
jgi:phosphoglycerol transferase MdoB-like AlkP superfamily enzyme